MKLMIFSSNELKIRLDWFDRVRSVLMATGGEVFVWQMHFWFFPSLQVWLFSRLSRKIKMSKALFNQGYKNPVLDFIFVIKEFWFRFPSLQVSIFWNFARKIDMAKALRWKRAFESIYWTSMTCRSVIKLNYKIDIFYIK